MSSNCPPQLQLSLQPSTTSFKRSFEQFGFDLESPGGATDAGGSGANNGRDRNKRARSASSFSESSDSMDGSQLSTIASGSSGSGHSRDEVDSRENGSSSTRPIVALAAGLATRSMLEPPRLPTPEIQDIEMPDYPGETQLSEEPFSENVAAQAPQAEDRYRLSLDRFNAFDSEMSVLRQPQSLSPNVPRSPTPPPILPPLGISEGQTRLSTSSIPFLHQPSHTATLTESFFSSDSPSSTRAQSPTTVRDNSVYDEQSQEQDTTSVAESSFQSAHVRYIREPSSVSQPYRTRHAASNRHPRPEHHPVAQTRNPIFISNDGLQNIRERLDSALVGLRSPSPLVPGLEVAEEPVVANPTSANNTRTLQNPPMLPPIITGVNEDSWNETGPLFNENIFLTSPTPSGHPIPSSSRSSSSHSTMTQSASRAASASSSTNLGDHPLPSPILRDLHSWLEAAPSATLQDWNARFPSLSVAGSTPEFANNNHEPSSISSAVEEGSPDRDAPSIPRRLTDFFPLPIDDWSTRRWADESSSSRRASVSSSTYTPTTNPPSPFGRRSADEAAVRSLDVGFDSGSNFAARPPPIRRSSNLGEDRTRMFGQSGTNERAPAREQPGGNRVSLDASDNEPDMFTSSSHHGRRSSDTDVYSPVRSFFTGTGNQAIAPMVYDDEVGTEAENPWFNDTRSSDSAPSPVSLPHRSTRPASAWRPGPDSRPQSTSVEIRNNDNDNLSDVRTSTFFARHRARTYGGQTPLGSSTSLVTENATEVRRRLDQAQLQSLNAYHGSHLRRRNSAYWQMQPGRVEPQQRQNDWGASASLAASRPSNTQQPIDAAAENAERQTRNGPYTSGAWDYSSVPRHSILPLPGISATGDADMFPGSMSTLNDWGDAWGNGNISSTLAAVFTGSNRLPPAMRDDQSTTSPSEADRSRPRDPFWLGTSSQPSAPSQDSMDVNFDVGLPSPTVERGIFDSRSSSISEIVNTIASTSTSSTAATNNEQRRYSDSSSASSPESQVENRPGQTYRGDPPSLPPPDLGGSFDAERHAPPMDVTTDQADENMIGRLPETYHRGRAMPYNYNPSLQNAPSLRESAANLFDAQRHAPPVDITTDPADENTGGLLSTNYRRYRAMQSHPSPQIAAILRNVNPFVDESQYAQMESNRLRNERQTERRRELEQKERRERARAVVERRRQLVNPTQGTENTTAAGAPGIAVASGTSFSERLMADLRWTEGGSATTRQRPAPSVSVADRFQYPVPPAPRAPQNPPQSSHPTLPPVAPYQSIDAATFTPGPFRNTMQQLFNERRNLQRRTQPEPSAPPTIPPLSFEDNDLSSLPQRLNHRPEDDTSLPRDSTQAPSTSSSLQQPREEMRRDAALRRRIQDFDRLNATRPTYASLRGAAATANENNRRRGQSDVHSYITRQVRMEASRLENTEGSPTRPAGDVQGLHHAIDVLRPDGLSSVRSQQLIDQFHRQQEALGAGDRRNATSAVGGPRQDIRRFVRIDLQHMREREAGPGADDEQRRGTSGPSSNQTGPAPRVNYEADPLTPESLAAHSARGRRGRLSRLPPEIMFSFGRLRRGRPVGDYMRDEDFDESYESLISLASTLGDAKPKSTSSKVLSGMKSAQYKDWATPDSDQRCPICLDDYQPTDSVLKLTNCSHWLHKDCLQQWLLGASSCPVCRKSVNPPSAFSMRRPPPHHHHHYHLGSAWRREPPGDGGPGPGPSSGSGPSGGGEGSAGEGGFGATLSYW
ncbi:hypothetical protein B0H34DRAFT_537887 [Crassisporium funariophilum]|nr:hypothetical protein B0H34DRAFT_537887 [Crassisporium funariophilum]